MSFQQSTSYVQAVYAGNNPGGSGQLDLPVVNMEVYAVPDNPDGGTAQEDYDGFITFEPPTFRLRLMLEWGYERTDVKPTFQNTLQDLIAEYMNGNGPLDFYVKYTGPSDSYDATAYENTDYICPKMIPDLGDEDGGIVFAERAREKERSIELVSQSSDLTWSQVSFTFD